MFNPCIEHCYHRYGKGYSSDCDDKCEYAKVVKEKKILEKDVDKPIRTLGELATQFCCLTECKNCPVMIHRYEKRTKYDKEVLHEPCCTNLHKWIIEQAKVLSNSWMKSLN